MSVDLPSPKSGIVADLPWEVGDVIPVGEVFMRIADPNESTAATPDQEQAPRIKAAPALRRYAKEQGMNYIYLGYWIKNHPKMHYKNNFKPLQLYLEEQWQTQ